MYEERLLKEVRCHVGRSSGLIAKKCVVSSPHVSSIRPCVGLCTELVSGEITRQSTAPLMTARYWCSLKESLINRAVDMSG
jgi:hypothetical protein